MALGSFAAQALLHRIELLLHRIKLWRTKRIRAGYTGQQRGLMG